MADLRESIQSALKSIASAPLRESATNLLSVLGYQSDRTVQLGGSDPQAFVEFVRANAGAGAFNESKALCAEWKSADLLFQLTDSELAGQKSLFEETEVTPSLLQSYLFFAIELTGKNYARGKLTDIARQINRVFPMPVMVLLKHKSQKKPVLSIAVINRRQHKREPSKDVLGKVTIIRDISLAEPHRGHLDILASFALDNLVHPQRLPINTFDALHAAWEEIFNVELLNKRFYRELANWYFWALPQVEFPADAEPDAEKRRATSLIRLLTRLIFCWFLKEKGLIPDSLFQEPELRDILSDLSPDSCSYHQGILQNLFFATLNQKMGKDRKGKPFRAFAKDEGFKKNRSTYGVDSLFRYEEHFHDADAALAHFDAIPFLNGGLFECLDRTDPKTKKKIYVDGFSRNKKKRPHVPNCLFFAEEHSGIDLSDAYGERSRRNEKVRGLLRILNSYKFTIVENTPIDQEIALDPELLGKVFENLLASYNEETKTTARKQTGSFYTPRPIVEYMVDQALIAHLTTALVKSGMSDEKARERLETLFAYTEQPPQLTDRQADALLDAIHTCKILDPACGSGAFPMGVLHKLVYIIHKLDPANAKWKQLQIDKAAEIPDSSAREAAIKAIEQDFADNEDDYGRKLYLVENCLYGVDIQPIAIQISKLRFFISLVCDQKTNRRKKDNLGIRPLPNLETKFVAADTLISLKKDPQRELFESAKVRRLESELQRIRHDHFAATTRQKKLALQKRDREIRDELAKELEQTAFYDQTAARKLADWDPHDPQASADYFEPLWMFDQSLIDGFDIVIGNPPYMGFRDMDPTLKARIKKCSATAQGKFDLYVPFIERGSALLAPFGILSFIMPTAFAKRDYGAAIRSFILKYHCIDFHVDFGHEQLFFAATNYTGILQLRKCRPQPDHRFTFRFPKLDADAVLISQNRLNEQPWILLSTKDQGIIDSLIRTGIPLGQRATISEGVVTGLNDLYLVNREDVFAHSPVFKPCLRGRDIRRFCHSEASDAVFYPYIERRGKTILIPEKELRTQIPEFMEHLKLEEPRIMRRSYFARSSKQWYELWNQRKASNFECEKVVTPELADRSRFAVARAGIYYGDTVCGIIPHRPEELDPYALAGILNSSTVQWYYKKATVPKANGFFIYKVMFLKNVPIPQLGATDGRCLSTLVRLISQSLDGEFDNPPATEFIIDLIDACVMECYFGDHMAERELRFLDHLAPHLEAYDPQASETHQREFVEHLYRTLNTADSPIRNRLLRLCADSPDLLAVIKNEGQV